MRKKQCTWIKIWSWIEGGWGGFKRKKWEKWQKGVEKLCFFISHSYAKWTIKQFWLQLKGKTKNWFRMTMQKFRSHTKCFKNAKLVLMHFPFRTIVRNCWSLCEIAFFQISWWKSLQKTSWMMPSVHLNLTYK